MAHVVLVGDTEGYVRAYDRATGAEVTDGGYPLRLTTQPYEGGDQGEEWWELIGGTATQMTVAAGLLLVGVNARTEESTVLRAYKLYREKTCPPDCPPPVCPPTCVPPPGAERPDLVLELLDTPNAAPSGGFTAKVAARCQNCTAAITTTISLKVDGYELPRKRVTFAAEQSWTVQVQWASGPQAEGADVPVVATLDPENRVEESDKSNNILRSTVHILMPSQPQNPDRWGSKLTD